MLLRAGSVIGLPFLSKPITSSPLASFSLRLRSRSLVIPSQYSTDLFLTVDILWPFHKQNSKVYCQVSLNDLGKWEFHN